MWFSPLPPVLNMSKHEIQLLNILETKNYITAHISNTISCFITRVTNNHLILLYLSKTWHVIKNKSVFAWHEDITSEFKHNIIPEIQNYSIIPKTLILNHAKPKFLPQVYKLETQLESKPGISGLDWWTRVIRCCTRIKTSNFKNIINSNDNLVIVLKDYCTIINQLLEQLGVKFQLI